MLSLSQKKGNYKMSHKKFNLNQIEKKISNKQKGLPEESIYLIGRMTTYINVDWLIRSPTDGI